MLYHHMTQSCEGYFGTSAKGMFSSGCKASSATDCLQGLSSSQYLFPSSHRSESQHRCTKTLPSRMARFASSCCPPPLPSSLPLCISSSLPICRSDAALSLFRTLSPSRSFCICDSRFVFPSFTMHATLYPYIKLQSAADRLKACVLDCPWNNGSFSKHWRILTP